MNSSQLHNAFLSRFGRPAAGRCQAPGRVNLIGEHTDYNDGFVLPMAIERRVTALYAPTGGRAIRLASVQKDEMVELDLGRPILRGEPAWANYPKGVAAGLLRKGLGLVGVDILFDSTIPLGGGLSSSAALEVATAMALQLSAGLAQGPAAADWQSPAVGGRELALLCQVAEHEYALAPVGIMDQSIAILGREGQALLLDCRSGLSQHIPFNDPSLVLLVADTQVKHELSDGGYASRRRQCETAAASLDVKALRDVTAEQVLAAGKSGILAGKELMRARHVVGEIERTLKGVAALKGGDYRTFGQLMYGSHASLRDDYEVSCEELDLIVQAASRTAGVFGARMTGGGFGGCAIILAQAEKAEAVTAAVQETFAQKFGRKCPIFATRAAGGAAAEKP